MSNAAEFLTEVSIWALPIMFAIILHEVMHGFVALQLGDDTAKRAGRLTLNPLSHIDLFGTVIMPIALLFMHLPVFGYAKPVPVDFGRLRNPRSGMLMVAAAGPLTNIVLAVASSIGMRIAIAHVGGPWGSAIALPLYYMLRASVVINVVLATFNLLPLLPLDGGRVVVSILPLRAARAFSRLEPFGFFILLLLLYTDSVERVINPIINAIARVLL
ncbi:MAG: site-2 protease family protein [Candidatus Binatus sp.]|uniref:site-2 protease family protein n=1 Tax=Candidatus Binatus sp. TaxID=2811406 RepID=UPI002723EA15|nr:site-2 protease family protein [Candidatus Binatus sp.]MDO8431414.1 site-2 protease family protein [Candidatus Binatus sp.]